MIFFFLTMTPFVLLVIMGIPHGTLKNVVMKMLNMIEDSLMVFVDPLVVDTSKWLQTPTSENFETDNDNSLGEIGWFPLPNIAGIARE